MAEANGGGGGEPVAHRTRGALEELPRSTTITLHQTPPGEAYLWLQSTFTVYVCVSPSFSTQD